MVILKVKGQEVQLSSAEYKLDLREYYMYLLVKVPIYIPLGESVKLVYNKSESDLYVRESVYYEPLYQVKLVTLNQYKSLNLKTKEFQGSATVKDLLANIGVKSRIQLDTIKSWWMLPKLSVQDLIRYLNKYSVTSSGGAPRFYLDLEGCIQYVDLIIQAKEKPVLVKAEVVEDYQSNDWTLDIPGTLGIVCSSVDSGGYLEEVCDSNLSYGIQFAIDTTGFYQKLLRQAYKNEYTWRLYNSRCISVNKIVSGPHSVGQYVSIGGVNGVILAFSQPLQLNNEEFTSSALIVCPE